MKGTSWTGVSGWARLTLRAVGEVRAVAQSSRRAGIGQRIWFGRTGRTHKPIGIQVSKETLYTDQLCERVEGILMQANANYQS